MTVWLAVSANHSSSPACFTPSFNTRVYFARQRDLCMFFQFIFSQGFHRCRIYKTFTPKCSDFSSVRCLSNLAWNVSLQDSAEGHKLWRNQINSSFMFFSPSLLSRYQYGIFFVFYINNMYQISQIHKSFSWMRC